MTALALLDPRNQRPGMEALTGLTCVRAETGGQLGNVSVQGGKASFSFVFRWPERPEAPLRGHRTRELEWRRAHRATLRQYAGQWVVLENELIVVHGPDPARLIDEARASGIRVPYIFKVENHEENVVHMGL